MPLGLKVAADYRLAAANLRQALEVAWRDGRYIIGFDDAGIAFEQASVLTAAWPVLSGAVGFERGRAALEAGLARVERANRIVLIDPPFDETSVPYPGRIADYPPGVRENGGQYSHGVSWVVDAYMRLAAEAKANGEIVLAEKLAARAFTCWVKISPIGKTEGEKLAVYG
ncbi:MAG: GH36-type glycosyl hydrolase domain-containing protein, partial [Bryobacteraceae bacterium]